MFEGNSMPRGAGLRDFMAAAARAHFGNEKLPPEWDAYVFDLAAAWGTRVREVALERDDLRQRLHEAIDATLSE